jgi:heme/copper-type cytochrome/quinol oxidase subunit 3
MDIPYAVERRADTGFDNATLGLWLFLASETMLFGALFSSYVLLRTGATEWPHGWQRLSVATGGLNTLILLSSAMAMLQARRAMRQGAHAAGRRALALTCALALLFLIVELTEHVRHLRAGDGPWRDTFFAIYFALTGVHALHVIGGAIVLAFLAGPGFALTRRDPARMAVRTQTIAWYWLFVDVVWLMLFVTFCLT